MKPSKTKKQFGQSMTEYLVVTGVCAVGIVLFALEGGDLDYGNDDTKESIVEGINTHEQNFKDQMMMP